MVEKKSAISYESIMKDLKARKYSPVYVLMGEEPFYIDKICDFISENVLKPEEQDFNQTVVFGADVNAMQVVDMCKGYPMMAEYRVVVVKEAQNLRNLEPLEKYLLNPVKTTILVLCHKNGSIDRRKKFIPQAEKVHHPAKGRTVTCYPQDESEPNELRWSPNHPSPSYLRNQNLFPDF